MKRRTTCLIIPPSPFLLDERVFPSLGILKVAASLEERGYLVDVIDLSGFTNYEDIVEEYALSHDTMTYGITATTPQMPAAARVARVIRLMSGKAKLIIGGPHPTLVAAAWKSEQKKEFSGRATKAYYQLDKMFDVVVAGDGEDAIFKAIEADFGFVDADDAKSPFFLTNERLNQTPRPARHLIDMGSYRYQIEGHEATTLIAQLGCPFNCGFCGGRQSPMLRRIRMRTTENVVAEVRHLYGLYGYTGFMFYDDELNVNKKMVELMDALSDLQSGLGVDFRLRGFVKSELFTEEQAVAMHRAGFRQLLTGFESGSPRILENINKRATREQNTRAVEIAKKHGLKVKALMSIGHPGESLETIEETRDWLIQNEPDDFDCTIITTYPGSPYYDNAVQTQLGGIWTYTYPKSGDTIHSYELDYNEVADYYKGDPDLDGGYRAYVFTDSITAEELVVERDRLEREVREKLGIGFNPSAASVNYEHSMGQGLPLNILRRS